MELILSSINKITNGKKFCNWLLPKVKATLLANIDDDKLIKWNAYLNENNVFQFALQSKYIPAQNILTTGIVNLKLEISRDTATIKIDGNLNLPDTYNNLESLCRLINYGNMEMPGYPFFDIEFAKIADELDTYYKMFMEEGN